MPLRGRTGPRSNFRLFPALFVLSPSNGGCKPEVVAALPNSERPRRRKAGSSHRPHSLRSFAVRKKLRPRPTILGPAPGPSQRSFGGEGENVGSRGLVPEHPAHHPLLVRRVHRGAAHRQARPRQSRLPLPVARRLHQPLPGRSGTTAPGMRSATQPIGKCTATLCRGFWDL